MGDLPEAFVEDGVGMQSANAGDFAERYGHSAGKEQESLDGSTQAGIGRAAIKYKLRDWLFSRQRYWGEPIPILHELDSDGKPTGLTKAVGTDELPVLLPEMEDFKPTGRPGGPLEKATRMDPGRERGRANTRAKPTRCRNGPVPAGITCVFAIPETASRPGIPEKERYWMPVDLYVGGAEHAVLHLLYSRFWHKVLFDRGYVSDDGTVPATGQPGNDLVDHLSHRRRQDRAIQADPV